VLMNKLLRVVQITGTETVFKKLPKVDPDPLRFAFDSTRIGLQCVYLFLQGKILVRKTLDLHREACVFVGFFLSG
jgi:hypothetical protein